MKKFLIPIFVFCICLPLKASQMSKNHAGLISLWHFNEGSGTIARDSLGQNHGTLTNTPTWETSPTMGWRVRTGSVSKFISIANETQFDFNKTDAFYGGVVFNRTNAFADGEMIMGKMTWDSSGYRLNINKAGTDGNRARIAITVKSGANFSVQRSDVNLSSSCLDGRNHSIVFTYDGLNTPTSWKIYIDGDDGYNAKYSFVFADTTITGAGMLNNHVLEISNSIGTVEWYGSIDEAFIGRGPISNVGARYLGKMLLRKGVPMVFD